MKLVCTFIPQAWVNDNAVRVDTLPGREYHWEVEVETLPEWHSHESDQLRLAPTAPGWVRDWDGPFEVEFEIVVAVEVTFTETTIRSITFELAVEEGVEIDKLECSDIHEMLDSQGAWDQPKAEDWLGGEIEERVVDGFEIAGMEPVIA